MKDFFFDNKTPYSNLYEWEYHFLDKDYIHWVDIYKKNIQNISKQIKLSINKFLMIDSFWSFKTMGLTKKLNHIKFYLGYQKI